MGLCVVWEKGGGEMRKEVIGNATLYCGDCMDVLPTLGKVDAVVTDPPYGMNFLSNHRTEKHEKIANDECDDLAVHVISTLSRLAGHSVYAFGRWDNIYSYPKPKSLITWVKNNWSMGDLLHEHSRQTEVIFFYPGSGHCFPCKRPTDVIYSARTQNNKHPTEKPVQLMMQIIKWTSGTILNPFMGSGTTGVAAIKLGRHFIGIEKEPKYFDIACKRIEQAVYEMSLFA